MFRCFSDRDVRTSEIKLQLNNAAGGRLKRNKILFYFTCLHIPETEIKQNCRRSAETKPRPSAVLFYFSFNSRCATGFWRKFAIHSQTLQKVEALWKVYSLPNCNVRILRIMPSCLHGGLTVSSLLSFVVDQIFRLQVTFYQQYKIVYQRITRSRPPRVLSRRGFCPEVLLSRGLCLRIIAVFTSAMLTSTSRRYSGNIDNRPTMSSEDATLSRQTPISSGDRSCHRV